MKSQPRVIILATGGTIAGKASTGVKADYASGQLTAGEMVAAVPPIQNLADIQTVQISNVGSQDMTFSIMAQLADRINTCLENEKVTGVVVTHGTDTMEETAYFLNLTVKSKKTVVLTGAMRPSTSISADGPLNLYNAVAVAADPNAAGRGVLVVMNDRIHGAHSLTKNNTTSVETFLSPIKGLMGTVTFGATQYFRKPFRRHTEKSEFSLSGGVAFPRVDVLYACVEMPADLIDCSISRGARGIIIAGDGNGNMNSATIERASQAVSKGTVIVRSSRVPTGTVSRNVEIEDDRYGFLVSDELNPAKARILLMLALLKKRSLHEIQQLFYSY